MHFSGCQTNTRNNLVSQSYNNNDNNSKNVVSLQHSWRFFSTFHLYCSNYPGQKQYCDGSSDVLSFRNNKMSLCVRAFQDVRQFDRR